MILPLWRLTTEIPASFTSGGIWLTAREMLFCTLTAAISGSVPGLKKTDMVPDPELLAIERIYVIFSTPLMASSKGRSTDLATVSALRSEEHTSELQSRENLVCRLLLAERKR